MEQINYEAEVRKVENNAICVRVISPHEQIGYVVFKMRGATYESDAISSMQKRVKYAWRSAYETLVSQNKIVNQNK